MIENELMKEEGTVRSGMSVKLKIIGFYWMSVLVLLILLLPLYIAPAFQEAGRDSLKSVTVDSALLNKSRVKKKMRQLKNNVALLDRKLDHYLPHAPYIIINTTRNRFYLYDRKGVLLREGFCSSGSYTKLVSENRTWVFKTPKGRMTVL